MQEECEWDGSAVRVKHGVGTGEHIRVHGSEYRQGDLLLRKGSRLNPGSVGLLAANGADQVRAIRRPKVAIVTTGSELVRVGEELQPGQIYDSNGLSLNAAVNTLGAEVVLRSSVPDEERNSKPLLKRHCTRRISLSSREGFRLAITIL